MLLANKCVAHPWQCDVMGHLTTRFYMGMFDDASYHLLNEALGLSPGSEQDKGLGWADVRMVIEYQAEVSAGDLLEIHGGLKVIGGKSVTAWYEMTNITRDELAATLEVTTVLFDLNARCALPLTDEMRAAGAAHLINDD